MLRLGVSDHQSFGSVIVVCMEHEADVRRFMLRAQQLGMTNRDYVYVMPDSVRDNNRSELWLDLDNKNVDSRDVEAKAAFKPCLIVRQPCRKINGSIGHFLQIEMSTVGNEELHLFKKEIIQKVKEAPFFYHSDKPEDNYVGVCSRAACHYSRLFF